MGAIIKLESAYFSYPGREIFRELSLSLEEGEILALIGPNSSGKTTLLKLMDGLLQPQRGKVFLDGEELDRLSRSRVAKRVAVVPGLLLHHEESGCVRCHQGVCLTKNANGWDGTVSLHGGW